MKGRRPWRSPSLPATGCTTASARRYEVISQPAVPTVVWKTSMIRGSATAIIVELSGARIAPSATVTSTVRSARRPSVTRPRRGCDPFVPSTSTSSPSRRNVVARFAPTTAGIEYSRATTAQWLRMPPASVTIAAARANSGVHGGAVVGATRTSPNSSASPSASDRTMRTRPRAMPGEPAMPKSSPARPDSGGFPPNILITAREIGSSGGGPGGSMPSIGGESMSRNRSSSSRRSATTSRRSAERSSSSSSRRWKTSSSRVDRAVRGEPAAQLEHDASDRVDDLGVDPVVVVLLQHRALLGRAEQELELLADRRRELLRAECARIRGEPLPLVGQLGELREGIALGLRHRVLQHRDQRRRILDPGRRADGDVERGAPPVLGRNASSSARNARPSSDSPSSSTTSLGGRRSRGPPAPCRTRAHVRESAYSARSTSERHGCPGPAAAGRRRSGRRRPEQLGVEVVEQAHRDEHREHREEVDVPRPLAPGDRVVEVRRQLGVGRTFEVERAPAAEQLLDLGQPLAPPTARADVRWRHPAAPARHGRAARAAPDRG